MLESDNSVEEIQTLLIEKKGKYCQIDDIVCKDSETLFIHFCPSPYMMKKFILI